MPAELAHAHFGESGMDEIRTCPSCGANVEGAKCDKCGAWIDYKLTTRGEKAFLVDKAGTPVWSCNLSSLDGPAAKKKIKEVTGLEEKS